MATHTIGTGGDFSTPQLWEDDIPATLTEDRIGQCLNEEFVDNPVIDISAHSPAGFQIVLETATGASFKDNVNVRTNALRYNASNGAGFRNTDGYAKVILVSGAIGAFTLRNLQVKQEGGSATLNDAIAYTTDATGPQVFQDLIVEKTTNGEAVIHVQCGSTTCKMVNVLVIHHGNTNGMTCTGGTFDFYNCNWIKPSNVTPSGSAWTSNYATARNFYNCDSFGFTTAVAAGAGTESGNNNATDLSAFGTGTSNQTSVTYNSTTPFVNGTAASSAHDFRLANDANALINNGSEDATNAPNDISGTARDAACEIGVWELSAGGGGGATIPGRLGLLGVGM